jgi:2,4-dienoyl-CoA reductase (NADPH2)
VQAGYDTWCSPPVSPRARRQFAGIGHPKVLSYLDGAARRSPWARRVALIGAGGIGFDVAEFLVHQGVSTSLDRDAFWKEWGIDTQLQARGGVAGIKPQPHPPAREVFLLQRKASKVGDGLGKTTGWIHRTGLKNKQVQMLNSVDLPEDRRRGPAYPHRRRGRAAVVGGGQHCDLRRPGPVARIAGRPGRCGQNVYLIGGADVAAELDAKRAINQGSRLAAEL